MIRTTLYAVLFALIIVIAAFVCGPLLARTMIAILDYFDEEEETETYEESPTTEEPPTTTYPPTTTTRISADTFRQCIYMLNNTCYEDGTGVEEDEIEFTIKRNNLVNEDSSTTTTTTPTPSVSPLSEITLQELDERVRILETEMARMWNYILQTKSETMRIWDYILKIK